MNTDDIKVGLKFYYGGEVFTIHSHSKIKLLEINSPYIYKVINSKGILSFYFDKPVEKIIEYFNQGMLKQIKDDNT